MRFAFYLFCLALLQISCTPDPQMGVAASYFPSGGRLKTGVVNKYYAHINPGPDKDTYTDIYYISYLLSEPGTLHVGYYNAGFELDRKRAFSFEAGNMIALEESNIRNFDTARAVIAKPVYMSWLGEQNSGYERMLQYTTHSMNVAETQKMVKDTVVEGTAAKLFLFDYNMSISFDGNTSEHAWTYKAIYAKDLGLYTITADQPNGEYTLELVEQMPLEEFLARSSHGRQRIGYIDPANVLDHDSGFSPCGMHARVHDYYNSSPHAGFSEGKDVMEQIIFSGLKQEKLFDENGYLTFRFVINCKGEAGWFVTEQTGFDYQQKQFRSETVDHLYNLVSNLKTWRPVVLDGQPGDAYFYLTFRLANGEITDILP